ncbi:MAG: hypothetical protein JXK50_05365 [Campylobacterales bacterium]|nr:hypothetical protein [Campylobacterales bacterium]
MNFFRRACGGVSSFAVCLNLDKAELSLYSLHVKLRFVQHSCFAPSLHVKTMVYY